jgi:hypothetical protein
MAARLRTPERIIYEPGDCDSWSIVVGAAAPPPPAAPAATVHRFAEQGHGQRSVHDVAGDLARQFRRDGPEPDEQRSLSLLRSLR